MFKKVNNKAKFGRKRQHNSSESGTYPQYKYHLTE